VLLEHFLATFLFPVLSVGFGGAALKISVNFVGGKLLQVLIVFFFLEQGT